MDTPGCFPAFDGASHKAGSPQDILPIVRRKMPAAVLLRCRNKSNPALFSGAGFPPSPALFVKIQFFIHNL